MVPDGPVPRTARSPGRPGPLAAGSLDAVSRRMPPRRWSAVGPWANSPVQFPLATTKVPAMPSWASPGTGQRYW